MKKKNKYRPLTDCGCNCKLCYCNEGACAIHPHCMRGRCKLKNDGFDIDVSAVYNKKWGLTLKWESNAKKQTT
jgi:hypothetical protein